jgi:hypothetical protein
MGQALTAMQAGSVRIQYVVAIEGYPYILTDGDTAAALAAWTGLGWSQALGGLFVEHEPNQQLHPWQPFGTGGKCVLHVLQDAADTLGIDMNRKLAGAETMLASELELNATTISVKDTSAFAASGSVHIGTERIDYTGKTATTFTGCTRGKFAPFLGRSDGSATTASTWPRP